MTSDVPGTDAPRRKTAIWVAAAAVITVVVIVIVVFATRGGGSGAGPTPETSYTGAAPSPSGSAPSTAPSSTVPSASVPPPTASGSPTVVPTQETATTSAPLDERVDLDTGVEVRVADVESVQGEAQGPGEIAGPALRVTVEVDNAADQEVSMELALVNLYYGADKTPASALSGPGVSALPAALPAGESARGSYVFSVPEDQRDQVTVEFSYSTDAPTVVFSGRA